MMRSLFSGVAGLKSHQTRMDSIGNNIANVNTTGYKSSRVTFADTLYQTTAGAASPTGTTGGTNPKQIGLGTSVASIDTIFTDGSTQSTGKNTDLAITGSGLFVVKDGSGTYYTRDGAFEFDAAGNYVLPGNGMYVQGWMGTDGTINTTSAPTKINIQAGKSMPSKATKIADYTLNLNSEAPTISSMTKTTVGTGGTTTTATVTSGTVTSASESLTLTMSDGTTQTISSVGDLTYTTGHSLPVTTTLTAYDSLGNGHSISVLVEKTGANTWGASLNGTGGSTTKTITESDGSTTTVSLPVVTIPFKTDGSYDSAKGGNGAISLAYSNGNGAAAQSVTLDFSKLTQYSGTSTVKASADGNAAGTLKSISIDSSGSITGTYTNGVKQAEAQVAIAQFNNPGGLTKNGSSLYTQSNNSGTANVKTASDLGVTITPSSLEMSNVDIANEFSDMIITQRGFQANSKIITVGDDMLETLINMKR